MGSGVEDMAVQGVSIALSPEDVERSVKFYVEQLGFTCTLQFEGFARVRLGAADIMLALPNAQFIQAVSNHRGNVHAGFLLPT